MKRETFLEQGFTEEQTTLILNTLHKDVDNEKKLQNQVSDLQTKLANFETMKAELDEFKRQQLSDTEKMEADKKEIEKNLADSRRIKNEAKVTSILSEVGITDEESIKALVTDDEKISIENATRIANSFKTMKEEVEKKTRESMQNIDLKPAGSNVKLDNDGNELMTKEKFNNLLKENYTKAKEWKDNNIELYNEMMLK